VTDGPATPPPPPPPTRDWDEPPPPFDPASAAPLTPVGITLVIYNALSVVTSALLLPALPMLAQLMDEEAKRDPEMRRVAEIYRSPWLAGVCGVGLLLAIVALAGSICLLRRRVYGLAMTGAVLTMVNPSGCCCVLGLGVGIWAVAVLVKPEVQAAFRRP
jgi:hypothetical protein